MIETGKQGSVYLHGRWEDRIKNVADETVDLIYTDPPYGMQYISNIPTDPTWNKSGKSKYEFKSPIMNDGACDLDWPTIMTEFFRVLKPDSFLVIHANMSLMGRNIWEAMVNDPDFHCKRASKGKFTYKGTVAWNKRFAIGGDLTGAMKRDWEPIIYFAKGKPLLRPVHVIRIRTEPIVDCNGCPVLDKNGKVKAKKFKGELVSQLRKRISEIGNDWTFQLPANEKLGFPTQKPLALCRQWIELASDKGDVVLDPFAGSGSIGVAAMSLGRISLNFEADYEVYQKFHSRINDLTKLAEETLFPERQVRYETHPPL